MACLTDSKLVYSIKGFQILLYTTFFYYSILFDLDLSYQLYPKIGIVIQ
ncbi:hypothetical protein M2475_000324 [Breznakia sp. PF5-3]|nr:hypothetical protein [Breznakia sp. PM6-1]MDF9834775.1 hypothetical protein [Breznakia sp. PF5-3]MDF9838042.1 hypothetical protein [Breznakia sp. PFB2-8]MDF9860028.1 hypothetical protein [Breznakia sp. PH5-24]